ncbi:MAG: Asp-tRNA(Asn)/Glu-tRNA(Gln) amidotransferase subunit GatB [Candidatus Falkowbacteria bacterium]|nr:Asp-tRNA(Asn)/Glu-tRNA(Gln) amidotransferase subunit GatB [Candidatus Falkowbacteria bacterium]
MKYDAIIGLEIHAELKTASKMFCSCQNGAGMAPNDATCPICLGHPGTLPVPNKRAIELNILIGLAYNCEINRLSKFDRKNYFYPDLPKGYQISQYDLPFAHHGKINLDDEEILITRIHLEEDTGKSFHPKNSEYTLIDFNRAGTPLLELVTEPTIRSAEEAKKFCQNYQRVLRYLGASNADMEKGEMRCEANVSIQEAGSWKYENGQILPTGNKKLNHKVEVKNINSFRAVEKAIAFEIERQTKELENGQIIIAETRGWDDSKNVTNSQRIKESAADYRYFPEPDIPPVNISDDWLEKIKKELIELPEAKKNRFKADFGIKEEIADQIINDPKLANFSESVFRSLGDKKMIELAPNAAGWIVSELLKNIHIAGEEIAHLKISPENFSSLIIMLSEGKITSNAGQEVLSQMFKEGKTPQEIVEKSGLEKISDEKIIEDIAKEIINTFPEQAEQYKQGKLPLLAFFLGKVMAKTGGKADPEITKKILENHLTK